MPLLLHGVRWDPWWVARSEVIHDGFMVDEGVLVISTKNCDRKEINKLL